MKYGCMSCGARYSIPDARVEQAGKDGLRVRCSRCRAIMVVAKERPLGRSPVTPSAGILSDSLAFQSNTPSATPLAGLVDTGVLQTPLKDPSLPANRSASGVFRAAPGVQRSVTGVFIPGADEADKAAQRVWYVAIDGRPRGPFSAAEMILLAEKGKVRHSSLVWRTSWSSWRALKIIDDVDMAWLLDVVHTRKQREQEAQHRAAERIGVHPVKLERFTAGSEQRPITVPADAKVPPPVPEESLSGTSLPALQDAAIAPTFEALPAPAPHRFRSWLIVAALAALVVAAAAAAIPFLVHGLQR